MPTQNPTVRDPGYSIELVYVTKPTNRQRKLFDNAAERWKQIISQDLPFKTTVRSVICGRYRRDEIQAPKAADNLLIVVDLQDIDGPWGVVGSAGPCTLNWETGLPVIGMMRFDVADLDQLEARGSLESVILHEMGHVLGIGTLWDRYGLVTRSIDPPLEYFGQYGNEGNVHAGRTGRAKVEDRGGPGTARGHWDELIYDHELMTGWTEYNRFTPISRMSVGALKDLGFPVDMSKADPYRVPQRRYLRGSTPSKRKRDVGFAIHGDVENIEHTWSNGIPKPGREADFALMADLFAARSGDPWDGRPSRPTTY